MIREGVPQFMASSDETKKPNQPRQADTNDLENLGMDELLNLYSKPSLTEGEIIKGKVVKITRSEEHRLNSSHSQISYAVFCLKKKRHRHSAVGHRGHIAG